MSKFAHYATRAFEVARDALNRIAAAEAAVEAAENSVRENKIYGSATAEQTARLARAQADLEQARLDCSNIRREIPYCTGAKLSQIRRELETALAGAYDANPAEIDTDTLTLLQSGILRPSEYVGFLARAKNDTMKRLVAHHAGIAAENYARQFGPDDRRVQELKAIALDGGAVNENAVADKLAAFDAVRATFDTCVNNTSMIGDFGGLVGPIVEAF